LINSIESSNTTSVRGKVRVNLIFRKQYIAQRARGVYLAAICQLEATFDLFYAAQSIELTFSSDDITTLNKRLKWQMKNKNRGLKYMKLDQSTLRLVIFIDAFFANNRDLSSQIEYVICLIDASNTINILH
jgi:hypothetical protein